MYSQKTPRSQRSNSSTRNIIDPDAPVAQRTTRARNERAGSPTRDRRARSPAEQSDLYASYPSPQRQDTSTASLPTASTVSYNTTGRSAGSSHSASSSSSRSRKPHQHTRPRQRRTSSRSARLASHVAAKKRLTISFGITTAVAGIIYLALFLSKTARGALFHVMSILLLISLLAIAAHSAIRWIMLRSEYREVSERRDKKRKNPRERGWAISRPFAAKVGGKPVEGVMGDDEVPDRAIPVYMREDDDVDGDVEEGRIRHEGADVAAVEATRLEGLAGKVRPPPPVYGNFRNSVRMNPNFLHVNKVDVAPNRSTPTYEQAVNGSKGTILPGMAGYRPPSYGSEGGLTAVLETRRRDVEAAMGRIHPLERERLDRLGYQGGV